MKARASKWNTSRNIANFEASDDYFIQSRYLRILNVENTSEETIRMYIGPWQEYNLSRNQQSVIKQPSVDVKDIEQALLKTLDPSLVQRTIDAIHPLLNKNVRNRCQIEQIDISRKAQTKLKLPSIKTPNTQSCSITPRSVSSTISDPFPIVASRPIRSNLDRQQKLRKMPLLQTRLPGLTQASSNKKVRLKSPHTYIKSELNQPESSESLLSSIEIKRQLYFSKNVDNSVQPISMAQGKNVFEQGIATEFQPLVIKDINITSSDLLSVNKYFVPHATSTIILSAATTQSETIDTNSQLTNLSSQDFIKVNDSSDSESDYGTYERDDMIVQNDNYQENNVGLQCQVSKPVTTHEPSSTVTSAVLGKYNALQGLYTGSDDLLKWSMALSLDDIC